MRDLERVSSLASDDVRALRIDLPTRATEVASEEIDEREIDPFTDLPIDPP